MNLYTTPYVPKELKEIEINSNNKEDKRRVATDASENINDAKSNNDLINSNNYDKWTNVGQISRRICKNEQNLNDTKVKSNSETDINY